MGRTTVRGGDAMFSTFRNTALTTITTLAGLVAPASAATFTTPGPTTFTAPATGLYDLVGWGAQGGAGSVASSSFTSVPGTGGLGAEIGGDFFLMAGETLSIVVGGQGGNGVAARGGGGGGGSFVLTATNTPLIIAGGGGGGGGVLADGLNGNDGGNGLISTSGGSGTGSDPVRPPGAGGTSGSGGTGGGADGGGGGGGLTGAGTAGGIGLALGGAADGGAGGSGAGPAAGNGGVGGGGGGFVAGGGGGGDSGGGGGGANSAGSGGSLKFSGGGGGGGGSFDGGLSNADLVLLSGVRTGNGEVTITPLFAISSVPEPTSLTLLAMGLAGLGLVLSTRRA
jgi:hypothetical protein